MEGIEFWKNMWESNLVYVTKIPTAIVTLVIGWLFLKFVRRIIKTTTGLARVNPAIQTMVLSFVNFAGWVIIVAAALSVMELNQLSLALGGSVALVAMALATGLNSVTQDLLAGIFLLGDPAFHVGARVKAGGVEGKVVELSIRKTKIVDDDGNIHTVPNRNVDQATYVIYPPAKDESAKAV